MDKTEITKILDLHKKWINGDSDGVKANLCFADLRSANLRSANLCFADLCFADLRFADLSSANLCFADLSSANLRSADLRFADLSSANLRFADLSSADLSSAKNLLSATAWLLSAFKSNSKGIIVYKAQKAMHESPKSWIWQKGKYLTEVCNLLPTLDCACGVNFATRDWIKKNYGSSPVWECLIEWIDLAETVVPYNTDGKARCSKLKLIKLLK